MNLLSMIKMKKQFGQYSVGSLLLASMLLSACEQRGTEGAHGNHQRHENHEIHDEYTKGPKGGRWFEQGDIAVEWLIVNQGVAPQLRVYAYHDEQPIPPDALALSVRIKRLGLASEPLDFKTQGNYWLADQTLREPHAFNVDMTVSFEGQVYRWQWNRVEAQVSMSDEVAKRSGIDIKSASPRAMTKKHQLPGEILLNQDRLAHITSRVSGQVLENLKRLGDRVEKGELLAVLSSPEAARYRGDYYAAEERLQLALSLFKREETLWQEKINAEQDYLRAKFAWIEAKIQFKQAKEMLAALAIGTAINTAPGQLARYEVRAPFSGVITQKHVSIGEAVSDTKQLFEIADLSSVWAAVKLQPRHLSDIRVGQPVVVNAVMLNQSAVGEVAWIGPLVGKNSRSATAYVVLENPSQSWRPGLFVDVTIKTQQAQVAVAVYKEALQSFYKGPAIFIRVGEQFEVRPLTLGRQDKEWVEVLSGLQPGDHYAASNSFVLKAELGKALTSHDH